MKILNLHLKKIKYYFTNNTVTLNDISKAFTKVSNNSSIYLEEITSSSIPMLDEIINKLKSNSKTDLNILDLGSGTGFNSNYLYNKLKVGNYTLIDISPGMIAKAKNSCDFNCSFIESDMLSYLISCDDNSIDVIISSYAISYHSPKVIIKECARVLKNGGFFGIIDSLKGNFPELKNINSKLLINHSNLLGKSIGNLNHFKYEYYFEKAFVDNRFNRLNLKSNSLQLNFDDNTILRDFISNSGILSPLDSAMDLEDPEVKLTLASLIDDYNITALTHKYIWGSFRNDK